MKKKHDTIESLLETGKKTGLTLSEQEEMWAELKSYTEFHAVQTDQDPAPFWSWILTPFSKIAVSLAAVILIVTAGTASTDSLPGEFLYDVKVNIVEPLIGLTHTSEIEQLNYELLLLDRRLIEMKEMSQLGLLDENAVEDLEKEVEDRSGDITQLLHADETIEAGMKLEAIANAETSVRTQEYIEDTKYDRMRKSKFESAADNLHTLYETEARDFVAADPVLAMDYLHTVLVELDSTIASESASTTVSGTIDIYDHLEDAKQALQKGDLEDALEYANEAHQVVELGENIEEILGGEK